ncbi:hypothetical protein [Actinoplanes lutulentus]|nr:hypothetical protein [Actinoplanes lutulentus]
MLAVSVALVRHAVVSPVYRGPALRRRLAVIFSANLAFVAASTLRVWLDLPYVVVAGVGVTVAAIGPLAYWRTADVGPMILYKSAVQPLSSAQARSLMADAQRSLDRAGGRIDRRLVAQLNLARATLWLSMRSDARESLAEVRPLIMEVLTDPRASRWHLLDAAADLVSAVDSYAYRHRDGRDYPVVLQIFADLAEGVPEAQAKLSECCGDYELFQAQMVLETAHSGEDLWPVVPHYTDAAYHLLNASKLAPNKDFRLVTKARAAMVDAQLTSMNSLGKLSRLESDEQECREIFAQFRKRDPAWLITGLALAGCLSATAHFLLDKGDRGDACGRLDEAERLCDRLLRQPSDYEPILRQLAAQVARAREEECAS